MNLKSSSLYIQAAIAALIYNLLHILAWELPIATRYGWNVNVIGDGVVIVTSVMSIILIAFRKKAGATLGFISAIWAIFFQWYLVYIVFGYKEPTGVWWYPLFPIFQGIMIVFFCVLAYRNIDHHPEPELEKVSGLRSPSIYLYTIAAFLLVQTGQKFVRELVVGFRQHGGLEGLIPSLMLTIIAIAAAGLLIKRSKLGLGLAIFSGLILLAQPIIYHIIMGKPCLGGIWWYPFFTAIQGSFILYFSVLVLLKERNIQDKL
jgi:hypothetical protein